MNPLLILYELTESFYQTMSSLFQWFSTNITLLGITFTPFQVIFSWATLGIILVAVLVKQLVPLT